MITSEQVNLNTQAITIRNVVVNLERELGAERALPITSHLSRGLEALRAEMRKGGTPGEAA